MHLSTACFRAVIGLTVTVEEFDIPRRAAGDIFAERVGGSGGWLEDAEGGGGGQFGAFIRGGGGGGGGVSAEDIFLILSTHCYDVVIGWISETQAVKITNYHFSIKQHIISGKFTNFCRI